MAQEKYTEGCSIQRPPLLEPNGFCFWKSRFEIYVKSKDIDLWQVIQNNNFYYEVEDSKMKLMKVTPYELLEDDQRKKLGKNIDAKMTIYNALPCKDYEHVFMCKTAKERAKVPAIEEGKDLATLTLDELIGNLKVYEMVLDNDGVGSKITKEKVKSLALKAKVTREQTSDDSDSQDGSDEDEETKLMAKNLRRLSRKGVKVHDKFDICKVKTKGGESSRRERGCNSEDGDEP
ncbi:hypothetical protein Tco_1406119 [Tanacetum coccineum]